MTGARQGQVKITFGFPEACPNGATDTGGCRVSRLRQFNDGLGHFHFTHVGGCSQLFDLGAIVVAGGEIHLSVEARRVTAEHVVDNIDPLKKALPILGVKLAQGGDGGRHYFAILQRGGPFDAVIALSVGQAGNALGGQGQIFQQDEAQQDRQRPPFAHCQWVLLLISQHKADKTLQIKLVLFKSKKGAGNGVDAWVADQRRRGAQLRQLLVVMERQILCHLA